MAKVLAVLGATGQQGSSVVDHVINDATLSKMYTVRAVTRSVDSPKAQQLMSKVEVVVGDVSDRPSLKTALAGVHTLFAMTIPAFGDDALDAEYNIIKMIADVAVEQGVEYIIFSTLPSVTRISGGKYRGVTPFDAKAKGEEYIQGLPVKSSFYCPGSFMENFASQTFLAPRPDPQHRDTWILTRNMAPEARMPLLDAVGDGGKFVGAILAEPDKFQGKTLCAATRLYTMKEMAAALSTSSGKTITYKQVSDEEFAKCLPPAATSIFLDYFRYIDEFGYFGPKSEELVAWAAANARGKLSTFEEFLVRHPYELPEVGA
ncbi:hypothetical protein CLAIMM_02078 [Cladophialophora immunda]|nr:hypothetical protein CLAIMM_02078 [Cladophialophora immunda]